MMSHFSGHTSKIDVIYLLWKPKLPQPLIQEPISQNLPSEKKSFAKAQLSQRHWMHFFLLELKTLTPKQKKFTGDIIKKKIFYTFFTTFGAVKLQSYKIARKSFYYIFDSFSLYREVKLKFFLLPVLKVILMKQF